MDLIKILPVIGYLGIFGIIFAETGLLIGFFLPGDSLLFTAGFLASQNIFDIKILVLITFSAAVIGDSVGYSIGKHYGRRLFHKRESFWFHPDHLLKAENFYEKHGKKTIVIARFVPVIRTFAPIVAGIGKMEYKSFLFYNVIGGITWAVMLPILGFFFGNLIPDVDKYLIPVVGLIIILSILPQAIQILKSREMRKQILILFLKPFRK
ncbi:MAG: VTT domain-containing protein [Candidatus Levybacteria bacterium]|nr:VTT domain-containing protein [Candidatus Levybacteria bacterium]